MLRKELLDFIKKYNKEFAIKGYSKLSKPDLQSKVEDVLKRKIPRSMIFKEYQGLKNKAAPKKAPAKKAAPKKAAPKKVAAKKATPAKKERRQTYYIEAHMLAEEEEDMMKSVDWKVYNTTSYKTFLKKLMTKKEADSDTIWDSKDAFADYSVGKKLLP
jgi:hypothetical protein